MASPQKKSADDAGATTSSSVKVYSPDMQEYSFEGQSGVISIIASFIVGPLRLISRVTHNIMILPADLLGSYADGLLIVGIIVEVLGIIDYVFFRKWPLFVSQIPVILSAISLKRRALRSIEVAETKHEVEIDNDSVTELCNTIYQELDSIVKGE